MKPVPQQNFPTGTARDDVSGVGERSRITPASADKSHVSGVSNERITEVLSRDEIQQLNQKSNLAGFLSLGGNWIMIAACFTLVAVAPNPLTVILALVLLGGRQLGLAVLMHDSAHGSLFRTRALNRFFGDWFCGSPILSVMDTYFQKHARHHVAAGSEQDPDRENYRHYAVSRASFRRKILRDLTGVTGFKTLRATVRASSFVVLFKQLLTQGALFLILWAVGHPELYLLWIGSWLTTNMLFSRLRQAAEHAVVPDLENPDPRMHTRTTLASWWERLTLAPNRVNYHLEHHLLPSVPPHNLARMHKILMERGFYEGADIAHGYREVVRRLTERPGLAATASEA